MSDDTDSGTEWVTIKIHEPLREDAREDPRTYNDIMRAGLQMAPVVKSQDGDIDLDALAQHISEHIGEVSMANEPGVDIQTEEIVETLEAVRDVLDDSGVRTVDADVADELAKVRDEIARVPERTAEELSEGY